MGAPRPTSPLEDSSDLADLWNEALRDFKEKTNLDLEKFQFKSMQDALDSTKSQQISFGSFRHDKGKVDVVRTAFGNNLKGIERVINTANFAANTASAFPPAIPGAALMTAFTFVFQTFKDVKADYDRVWGFFDQMSSFLDRISMLETKSPRLGPLERCIRKVFTAMLTMCGIAADYKSKGRFKKWFRNAIEAGQDPKLADAYSAIDDAIEKLGSAVGIATLRTSIETKETANKIDGKTDTLLSHTSELKTHAVQTHDGVLAIQESVENLNLGMSGLEGKMTLVDTTVSRVGSKMDANLAFLTTKIDALLIQGHSGTNVHKSRHIFYG